MTGRRFALVYHAAYWKPAYVRMPSCWKEALLTRPSYDTK
jgi:hypothetical protein